MSTEITIYQENQLAEAFQSGTTQTLIDAIEQQVKSIVPPDVTTKKGRDELGSLALKISKSKTALEKAGKELVADQKAAIKKKDDDRILAVKRLDALRAEVLAPRDAWEKAEETRKATHEFDIAAIRHAVELAQDKTAAEVLEMQNNLEATSIDGFEEYQDQAKLAKAETLNALAKIYTEKLQREAEQAELERLRQAEAERQRIEHEQRIAEQAAAQAKAEAEAKAQAEREASERAMLEQQQAAERAAHEAQLREAKLKAEAEAAELRAQQAAQAERDRIAAQAEAQRRLDEQRAADKAHQKRICEQARDAILALGIDEETTKTILNAIYQGKVPNVSINF